MDGETDLELGVDGTRRSLERLRRHLTVLRSSSFAPAVVTGHELTSIADELSNLSDELTKFAHELQCMEREVCAAGRAVEDRERRYQEILSLLPLGCLETDLQGTIRWCSDTACSLLAASPERLLGRTLTDLVVPQDRQVLLARLRELVRDGPGAERRWGLQLQPERGEPIPATIAVAAAGGAPGAPARLRWMLSEYPFEGEGERRYRQMLASTTDYVYQLEITDGHPVHTTHGPGCVAITGYSSEEFAADPLLWHRMVHEDDKDAVSAQAAQMLSGGEVSPLEHRVYHKDGSLRWLRNTPIARYDEQGLLVAFDGLITDITERKLAEEALRESEEKYRTLVRASTDAIFIETLQGRVLDCNEAACEIFGYSREELIGLTVADLVPQEVAEMLPQVIEQHQEQGGVLLEAINRRKNGQVFPCEVSTQVMTLGGETRVIAYVRDISERREAEAARLREREAEARAAAAESSRWRLEQEIGERRRVEAALRESEAKFRTLAEQSPNMILINKMGRIVYANEACEEILGYSREELCSAAIQPLQLFAPEFVEQGRYNYQLHQQGQEVAACEYTLLAKSGARIEVIFSTRLIDYEGERAILGMVTDITERKREEESLRRLQREITDLPAKEQRRIGQELHDNLGQQLTGIGMLTKSLSQKLRARGTTEAAEAEQIFSLVQEAHAQMRALSRGLVPVEVDAKGLMSALGELAAASSRLPGVSCRFVCTAEVAVEDNDIATQLYRIAQEALNNALMHADPESVTISLETADGRTTLQVHDNGHGFDVAQETTGMGLRIMRSRAATIGAELVITSAPDGGTRVTCTIGEPTHGGSA